MSTDIKKTDKPKVMTFVLLHFLIALSSLNGICSKMASRQEFLSLRYIFFYGLMMLNLAFYAVMWQQILKKLPLTVAYSNKSVGMIWVMLWGALIFKETISVTNIIGSAIVLIGALMMVSSDE